MKQLYDKAKAHEYYMKHRKLKGKKRKVKPKVTAGKVANRKKKRKATYKAPKNISLQTKNAGGTGTKISMSDYDKLSAKLGVLKDKIKDLTPAQKTALKGALGVVKQHIRRKGK